MAQFDFSAGWNKGAAKKASGAEPMYEILQPLAEVALTDGTSAVAHIGRKRGEDRLQVQLGKKYKGGDYVKGTWFGPVPVAMGFFLLVVEGYAKAQGITWLADGIQQLRTHASQQQATKKVAAVAKVATPVASLTEEASAI